MCQASAASASSTTTWSLKLTSSGSATMPSRSGDDIHLRNGRWPVFILACATSWLLYLHRCSWGVIKPAFRKDNPGLTDGDIGWLDGAFNASYAIGQVPGGLAGDVLGPRVVLSVIILVWSLAAVGIAW